MGPQLELNTALQEEIDSLKNLQAQEQFSPKPVNPNYISDYRGYLLGMSLPEIDRLHAYRERGLFLQTPDEFQRVTEVSDSLFLAISPNLRFPKPKKTSPLTKRIEKRSVAKKDLNTATASELKTIYGIGDVLSKRIVKFRNALGGFLDDKQLYDVYGLEEEVVQRVLSSYEIIDMPEIEKVSINTATVSELASSLYLSWDVSREIVAFRDSTGGIKEWRELAEVPGFPIDKIERIKLYLTL
ncbi:MAG: helix-hairpin-helix domain-containing protein [Flavobacteriaceae bacterium]|nr:helix-hairpin-helix domain-containing protein [Flavobacteriaceae bacterium]